MRVLLFALLLSIPLWSDDATGENVNSKYTIEAIEVIPSSAAKKVGSQVQSELDALIGTKFDQDAVDNRAWLAGGGKLRMPVLALGGEKSFGLTMAAVMRAAATNVKEGVVAGSGHWIMEENPKATTSMVRAFLEGE